MSSDNNESSNSNTDNNSNNSNDLNKSVIFTPPPNVHQDAEPKWRIDDKTVGDGDKPEWLMGENTVMQQAELAYKYRKALGERESAPDNYDVKLDDAFKDYEINNEDEVYQEFSNVAKELKLSNNQFNKLVNLYVKTIALSDQQLSDKIAQENKEQLKSLGIDAPKAVEEVTNYLINQGVDENTVNNIVLDPYNVKAWYEIKNKQVKGMATPDNFRTPITKDDIVKMKMDKRYNVDPSFTADVTRKIQMLVNQNN